MENRVYDVMDIARYVINYECSKGYNISNLRLQKILYFIQAAFLDEKNKPCFKEEIEAWDFGPVVPEVYHEFKMYGGGNIPYIDEYIDYSNGIWNSSRKNYNNNFIDEQDKKLINDIVEGCNNFTVSQLVNITHNQSPWLNAYVRGLNNIISKESIRKFFKED